MPLSPLRIGFLGAGQMATALAKGWLSAGWLTAASSHTVASDPYAAARDRFTLETGLATSPDNASVVAENDVIVLAVKPLYLPALLAEVQHTLEPRHLVVSIVAGVRMAELAESLVPGVRVVRVMPNTPAVIGECAAGYSAGAHATAADVKLVGELFGSIGKSFSVPESQLDAVTGLSGSGPAFVYVMIEALADGGVLMGLPRQVALELAAQTVLGAAKMVLQSGLHPGALKDAVASPGGTTIAGLHALEKGATRSALMDAVKAATLKSIELGRQ